MSGVEPACRQYREMPGNSWHVARGVSAQYGVMSFPGRVSVWG